MKRMVLIPCSEVHGWYPKEMPSNLPSEILIFDTMIIKLDDLVFLACGRLDQFEVSLFPSLKKSTHPVRNDRFHLAEFKASQPSVQCGERNVLVSKGT